MNSYELYKKNNKRVILSFLLLIPAIVFLIVGMILSEQVKSAKVVAIIMLVLSAFSLIAYFVLLIVVLTKVFGKQFYISQKQDIEEAIRTKTGKKKFESVDHKQVYFGQFGIQWEDHTLMYDKTRASYANKIFGRVKSLQDMLPAIELYDDDHCVTIPIDGDLLELIQHYKIEIDNQEDFDFYMSDIKTSRKQITKSLMFRGNAQYLTNVYMPMVFAKNKEEMKDFKKISRKSILITFVSIIVMMGIYALVLVLSTSKKAVNNETLQFSTSLIINILLTVIILLCIFVKAKKVPTYAKFVMALYIVLHWIYIFLLPTKVGTIINCVFQILFLMIGIASIDKSEMRLIGKNPKIWNRSLGMFLFLSIMLLYSLMDFTCAFSGRIWLIVGILTLISLPIVIYFIIRYLKKSNEGKSLSKNKKIGSGIGFGFCAVFLLVAFIFLPQVVNLNYALDTSKPIIYQCEILELKLDVEDGNHLVIKIEGKRIEISISTKEYYALKEGQMVEIKYYKGAFGAGYYMY